MDEFFSKYGWVIVAGIVIVSVIAFVPGVAGAIETAITDLVTGFQGEVGI